MQASRPPRIRSTRAESCRDETADSGGRSVSSHFAGCTWTSGATRPRWVSSDARDHGPNRPIMFQSPPLTHCSLGFALRRLPSSSTEASASSHAATNLRRPWYGPVSFRACAVVASTVTYVVGLFRHPRTRSEPTQIDLPRRNFIDAFLSIAWVKSTASPRDRRCQRWTFACVARRAKWSAQSILQPKTRGRAAGGLQDHHDTNSA
jgi:hypothetical protein